MVIFFGSETAIITFSGTAQYLLLIIKVSKFRTGPDRSQILVKRNNYFAGYSNSSSSPNTTIEDYLKIPSYHFVLVNYDSDGLNSRIGILEDANANGSLVIRKI